MGTPSTVLRVYIRNFNRWFISSSFLITRSISRCFTTIVMQFQQWKGRFFNEFVSKEFMCFRSIQNLDEKPPKIRPFISEIWQLALDYLYVLSFYSFLLFIYCDLLLFSVFYSYFVVKVLERNVFEWVVLDLRVVMSMV